MADLIRDVRDRTQSTIVLIEHDIPLVSGVADELLALETSNVVTRGTPDEVLADERVIAAYLGRQAPVEAA